MEELLEAYPHLRREDVLAALKFAADSLADEEIVFFPEAAGVELTREQVDLLADVNAFNIEARYPDHLAPPPSGDEARGYLARIEEAMKWLMTL